jgi:hypothetical protein
MRVLDFTDGFTSATAPTVGTIFDVTGSTGTPTDIVDADGITPGTSTLAVQFIQGSGGAVDITANPQIEAGTTVGQQLVLVGCSDSNTVKVDHGTGVVLRNGSSLTLKNHMVLSLLWDGTNWVEMENTALLTNADISTSAAIAYSKLALTGSVVNADVSGSAAIAYSKLNLSGGILNADVNASAAIAYSKLNLSASIVNADVATGAAIAHTKLANITAGSVLLGNGSNVPTATALSGDVTVTSGGVTAIGATKVTNAMLAGSIDLTAKVTGTLPIGNGGTGITTAATGDLIYASGTNTWAKKAIGSTGDVLTVSGGVPAWSAPSGSNYTVTSQTTTYSILTTDAVVLLSDAGASFTATLPTAVGVTGKKYILKKTNSSTNTVTIATTSSQTIGSIGTTRKLCTQDETWVVYSDGSNWQIESHKCDSAWSSSLTFTIVNMGTVSNQTSLWRRLGDNMHARINFKAGTVPGSEASITLPSGHTMDFNKLPATGRTQQVGTFSELTSATGNLAGGNLLGAIVSDMSTSGSLYFADQVSSFLFTVRNASAWANNSDVFTLDFIIPITNWDA